MLFDPARHVPLAAEAWSAARARAAVRAIVDAAVAAFDDDGLWAPHPGDLEGEPADQPLVPLYHGAAGVIWALRRLAAALPAGFEARLARATERLLERSHGAIAAGDGERASYFLRDAGILLLRWQVARESAVADALHALIEGNLANPTREALWGSPGTLIACIHLGEALPDDPRWPALLRRGVDRLEAELEPHGAVRVWVQDLYGRRRALLGAGHGFAGNVYPVLRGRSWLDPAQVARFEALAFETLEAFAIRDGEAANWQPVVDPRDPSLPPLVQDCHGAPGVVCRLAGTRHEGLKALLVAGGEATWRAGPLAKPPGLCHGTDGNGYAFLKLHAMTGDARWLARARAFAMHAVAQSEAQLTLHGRRRFSLWTGDLGLAMFLDGCLREDAAFPTLDVF